MEKLMQILREAGRQPIDLNGKILIMPFGGRVLGLFPQPEINAFWVNPALADAHSAKLLFSDPGWINLGGDRTWISPEVETHIQDPERGMETSEVPKGVDPAAYQVASADAHSVSLTTKMQVDFMRTGAVLDLKLSKTISLLESPPLDVGADLTWAGYSVAMRLDTNGLPSGVRPALWNIIQVAGGGRIVVPVNPGCQPRAFIGIPVYRRENDVVVCDVKTAASFKLSLYAQDSRGMLIYFNEAGPQSFLIVRTFAVGDACRYSDTPYDDQGDTGHVEQVYVDDGALGGFGELEYHSPALEAGDAATASLTDRNRVWAFAGPARGIQALIKQLEELAKSGL